MNSNSVEFVHIIHYHKKDAYKDIKPQFNETFNSNFPH